ncbi:MAG: hypothetical protein AMK69_25395 [Nitrospira bacterium SG8_3]|nr:MAG: hypothetical protein AMK69_25395 [Nitrospira bacterium SG8_3]
MFGSFILRELFSENQIIRKLFGGVNILLFWVVSFSIFHKIDRWIFGKDSKNFQNRLLESNGFIITKKILLTTIIICLLFFVSLRYLDGWKFILFWIIFVISLWITGLITEQRHRKNTNKGNKEEEGENGRGHP